jgi:hypothetical protein
MLGFFAKLYLRVLGLASTPNLRMIFIILIITLNLHDPSLSGSGCNPDLIVLDVGLAARSCYKSVIIK